MFVSYYLFLYQDRLKLWNKLKEKYDNELANKVLEPITVTFPDGKTTCAKAWQSTPYDVAKGIRFETITILYMYRNSI